MTAETAKGCTAAEVGYAFGMEYLYNGQYGVSTGGNGLYYMRARYYNQDIKRFINRDILSGNIGNSQSLNRYCYVQGNPVSLTDPVGLCPTREEVYKNRALKWLHIALDAGGFLWDGFDVVNVLLYHFEGRDTEAAITLLCLIPGIANFLTLPIRLTVNLGSNAGEALIKLGKKYLSELVERGSRFLDWAGGKIDDVWRWIQKKLGKAGVGNDTISVDDFIRKNVNPNFQKNVKEAFMNDAKVTVLEQDVIVYRYHGGKSSGNSYWYTPMQTSNPAADLALPQGNTYQYMDTYIIPKGTTILEGTVAPNFGQPGGGYQFYVPDPSVARKL